MGKSLRMGNDDVDETALVAASQPCRSLSASCTLLPPRALGITPRLVGSPVPLPVIVGYLSDFVAVDGAQTLFDQAERLAKSGHARRGLKARYIDSGRQDGPPRMGPALSRLVRDAHSEGHDAVLVDTLSRFGPDLMTAFRVALEIIDAGLGIYEAEGDRIAFDADTAARIMQRAS